MNKFSALILVGGLYSCDWSQSYGPPVGIRAGTSDTVIINNRAAVRIPIRVLDAKGRTLPDSGVRFRLVDEQSNVKVASNGVTQCTEPADIHVETSLNGLRKMITVRCRPVEKVYIAGPVQFLLPDSAQEMRLSVLDREKKDVNLLSGTSWISDTAIATIDGLRIKPKSPGVALAEVRFGNQSGRVGVHVYERATSLDGLARGKELLWIPLHLQSAEMKSWDLPPGTWMLTMLPYDDERDGLRMRIEGASCSRSQLTPRRYACLVKTAARVIVYNPSKAKGGLALTGQLLVRHINS